MTVRDRRGSVHRVLMVSRDSGRPAGEYPEDADGESGY